MASSLPSFDIQPPGTPPTPALKNTTSTGQGDPSFQFVCDDFDQDQDQLSSSSASKPAGYFFPPSPRSSPAAFLHPDHTTTTTTITARTEKYKMQSENGLVNDHGSGTTNASVPKNPFNFQTQVYSAGPVKSNIGQRRGHRYKHSSISATHQIFQEPPPRPPPVLPASLPIPTLKEAWHSMQRDQRARLYWCCCHAAVAVYVFLNAEGSLALTALSHLVFFDVGSAAVCVAVDVLGNFEVWRRSSIRHPFGLQRAEVLAGFAMSVFLVFGGFDLISHNLKDLLEGVGHHAPHHPPSTDDSGSSGGHGGHSHGGTRLVEPGTIDFASLVAAISTLISAYGLRNHNRIRRVMRVPLPYLSSLLPGAGVLANPFHFLTLSFAVLILILPLFYVSHLVWLDPLICAAIAASMFVLGFRLAVAQGLMLLMSYSGQVSSSSSSYKAPTQNSLLSEKKKTDGSIRDIGSGSVSAVLREIEAEPQVARVEEAQFWQVHYGLAMANLKVCLVRGAISDDGSLSQLRSRLARMVQNRLGGEGYGRGGSLRWEVTIQMSTDQ
ncbi:cation efflux family-domain-containing protein [Podospora fimiseda]|uniref:Zinc transporter n=1 Tax=Podospora fimiseda TaxID=252190 RepID=A0AAN7BMC0_9PEZI|nr:cation efflux family-domain-containing protein [Podospora fimiseda]